jgi:ribosomal protein S7
MLTIQNKNIYNSKVFEKFINKLFLKGKKFKYLKIINVTLNNLKRSKLKPKFFFFLILEKLKPIFFFSTIKKKRKKKIKVTYKPFLLSIKQQYLISIK